MLSNSSSLLNEVSRDGEGSQISQQTPVPQDESSSVVGDSSSPATAGTGKAHVPLTSDMISLNLSVLARTGNGLNHAYVKLELHEKGITGVDGIDQFPHLRYVVSTLAPCKQKKKL